MLGLAYQPLRVRQPAPAGETSAHRTLRQREADLWLEGLRASGQAPPDCCWVDGGDAAAASDEAMAAARTLNHPFRLRVAQDRLVLLDPKPRGPEPALRGYSRSWPSQGQSEGDIPSRGGRPARTAAVPRAAAPVWIPAPTEVRQRWAQPILEAWVIRVGQADPPADVQEPLEWLLGCSLPTVTRADINERRTWSSCRWRVEVFHDIEKNGCSEADRRFETAAAREACLAVLSVVAVHSFQLRGALENQPEAPAEQVATASEIAGVRRFSGHKKGLLTGRAFVRGVARRGGFLGRKGDGDPGVRSLWRGYQRLQDMIVGFHRHDSPKPDATG